jgi:hypothetical protein
MYMPPVRPAPAVLQVSEQLEQRHQPFARNQPRATLRSTRVQELLDSCVGEAIDV